MHCRIDRFIRLIVFGLLLALSVTACAERTRGLFAPRPTDERPIAEALMPTATIELEQVATAESTAQAALQAAVQTLQLTPTEAAVGAAGGAPATPTAPILTEGPSAAITPLAGSANTQVTVSGSGFPANVRIDVYLAGLVSVAGIAEAPRSYANTVTDQDGNYSISFVMPGTWPSGAPIEPGRLAVVIATQDFRTRASVSFDYVAPVATPTPLPTPTSVAPPTTTPTPARNPFAEVIPLRGGANTQVTLRGGGFPANTIVNVHLGTFDAQFGSGGAPVRYGSTVTDGGGYFTLTFTMPATWPDGTPVAPGRLLILVATENFSQQASAIFDYLTPTPTPTINPYAQVQPASGSANTQVTVQGGGFPPNTRLNLYLSGLVSISAAGEAPTSYAATTTDSAGNYRMTFTMPGTWPDGDHIQSGTLALLVATEDFGVRASVTFDFVAPTPTAVSTPGWQGNYYDNPSLRNEPVLVRDDPELHFYWGRSSPDPILPSDEFSASWQRDVRFESGVYRFTVEMDDGARLYLNNLLILESWRLGERRTLSVDYPMQAGEYTVRLDYFEHTGDALVNLRWAKVDGTAPVPTVTPGAPNAGALFDDDPRNNRRRVNQYFCSGFESECEFAGCARNYRLVWGPYCREGDYPYIRPGWYRVTVYGIGPVRAGATDYGATAQLFAFGQHQFDLPGSFTFCWPGRPSNGYGFETIVQSTGIYAAVDWITIEYLGEQCP